MRIIRRVTLRAILWCYLIGVCMEHSDCRSIVGRLDCSRGRSRIWGRVRFSWWRIRRRFIFLRCRNEYEILLFLNVLFFPVAFWSVSFLDFKGLSLLTCLLLVCEKQEIWWKEDTSKLWERYFVGKCHSSSITASPRDCPMLRNWIVRNSDQNHKALYRKAVGLVHGFSSSHVGFATC